MLKRLIDKVRGLFRRLGRFDYKFTSDPDNPRPIFFYGPAQVCSQCGGKVYHVVESMGGEKLTEVICVKCAGFED